jgi:hypothetical protein
MTKSHETDAALATKQTSAGSAIEAGPAEEDEAEQLAVPRTEQQRQQAEMSARTHHHHSMLLLPRQLSLLLTNISKRQQTGKTRRSTHAPGVIPSS